MPFLCICPPQVRARLGIGRANPLAGLAMAMKSSLRKMSPHSSPSAERKPPGVTSKPTKKPAVGTPATSFSPAPPKEEAKATSTPKEDIAPSPLSTPVKRRVDTPTRGAPATSDSVVSDSSLVDEMSELFPKGNSRLFGDDEIDKLFGPAEEPHEKKQAAREKSPFAKETQHARKNEALGPAGVKAEEVKRNSPVGGRRAVSPFLSPVRGDGGMPVWKKQLQEQRAVKEEKKNDSAGDSEVAKEGTIPEWKKELARRRKATPEPSPEKLTKPQEPTKEVTPPKEVSLKDDVSSKNITAVPAEEETVAKEQSSPPPEAMTKEEPEPETVKDDPEKGREELTQSVANVVEEVEAEKTVSQTVEVSVVEPTPSPHISTLGVAVAEGEKVTLIESDVKTAEKETVSGKQLKGEGHAKSDSGSVPEWKQRLEERRASREKKEMSPVPVNKGALLAKTEVRHASREKEMSPVPVNKEALLAKAEECHASKEKEMSPVPVSKEALLAKTEERHASREKEMSPVPVSKEAPLAETEERRASTEEKPAVPVSKEAPLAKAEERQASTEEKPAVPVGKEALLAKSEERRTSTEKKPPVPVGKAALLAKSGDAELPEWRRRLLERKKELGSASVPTKTAAVTSSEPEWKKRVEERRKQKEAEKLPTVSAARAPRKNKDKDDDEVHDWQKRMRERKEIREREKREKEAEKLPAVSSARAPDKDKEDDEIREWQKRMRERKEIREREKKEKEAAKKGNTQTSRVEFDASVSEKGPEKKPLFDSSLLPTSEKRGSEKKDEAAKDEENKAKIESLFADDDEDILFKFKKSPPPQVEEVFGQLLEEVVESAPTLVKQESPCESPPQGIESDAAALKDWVVVGEEEVKQADKDKEELERSVSGAAPQEEVAKEEVKKMDEVKTSASSEVRAGNTAAVKNAERTEKRDVRPSDSHSGHRSPISLRKTPSPREQETKSAQPSSGPSWLDQAKKMREANQSKFQRTKSPASVLPKSKSDNQEMPEWRRRLLEKRQQQVSSSSSSPSVGSKPSSASSVGKNRTASPSRGKQDQTDNLSKRSELKVTPKAAETSAGKTLSSSGTKTNRKASGIDEEMPDWQQRLHERKLARQAQKEKSTASGDKPVVKAVEEQVTVKAPKEAPPALTETKEAEKASLFDDDGDLPDWKSKLSARKKLLEQKKDELGVLVTPVTEVEQRSSSVPPVDKEPSLKPKLTDKPVFSSSEQIHEASGDYQSRGSVSSEEEVFSPVHKTAPDSSDTSCKESTQASQASLISISDTASSVPRSATISGLDSEEKEDTPPPGCVRRTSLKFSPTRESQQQETNSGVPRWKKDLMNRRKKNLDQDSGSMTGSTSSMDSKGVCCDND